MVHWLRYLFPEIARLRKCFQAGACPSTELRNLNLFSDYLSIVHQKTMQSFAFVVDFSFASHLYIFLTAA